MKVLWLLAPLVVFTAYALMTVRVGVISSVRRKLAFGLSMALLPYATLLIASPIVLQANVLLFGLRSHVLDVEGGMVEVLVGGIVTASLYLLLCRLCGVTHRSRVWRALSPMLLTIAYAGSWYLAVVQAGRHIY